MIPYFTMKHLGTFLLFIALSGFSQEIPLNENLIDDQGLRQGKWTILYDSDWNEITDEPNAKFYRIIEYENDKPIGVVRDYYRSGHVQMEATLLEDRPESIMDGEVRWYRENGVVETKAIYEKGKFISEDRFDENGNRLPTWEELTDLGLDALNKGDYHEAEKFMLLSLDKALESYGKNHPLYVLSSNCLYCYLFLFPSQ